MAQSNLSTCQKTSSPDRQTFSSNNSFLHSRRIQEERQAFLNFQQDENKDEHLGDDEEEKEDKKCVQKRISFKVKKTLSSHRSRKVAVSTSKVAELTVKFNEMIKDENSGLMVKRNNGKKDKVCRKPSVKTKPNLDNKLIIVRKLPLNKRQGIKTKINNVQTQIPPSSLNFKPEVPEKPSKLSPGVKATIEIFERNLVVEPDFKPKTDDEIVRTITIPAVLPQRRCDSMYETHYKKMPLMKESRSEESIKPKPNQSFLWRMIDKSNTYEIVHNSPATFNHEKKPEKLFHSSFENKGDVHKKTDEEFLVSTKENTYEQLSAADVSLVKHNPDGKIYEELRLKEQEINHKHVNDEQDTIKVYDELKVGDEESIINHSYEYCTKYEKVENYESIIYETLPPLLPKNQQLPLPPRPPSRGSYYTIQENSSNCYESICNPESKKEECESNYESVYDGPMCSIRDSVLSDLQCNSLYGRTSLLRWDDDSNIYCGKAGSLSSSDKSDEWVDMTDNEENDNNEELIIFRERQKIKKLSTWCQQYRDQCSKSPKKIPLAPDPGVDSESDHHYESLYNMNKHDKPEDDYDSFDSDLDSDSSSKYHLNDSGVNIANNQLPKPPNEQTYVLTKLAVTAGEHIRKLRRNWYHTKNSLGRMTKRKSRTDLKVAASAENKNGDFVEPSFQNIESNETENEEKSIGLTKGLLNKFRRSMSMNAELATELTSNLKKPKSTFYLTEDIDIDPTDANQDSGISLSPPPTQRSSRTNLVRPQSPPPPRPIDCRTINNINVQKKNTRKATSWYAEVGLFKNLENQQRKRPNTFWYAEVGLYQSKSTPSTSSAENSGNTNFYKGETVVQTSNEELHNSKNEPTHYSGSNSLSSADIKQQSLTHLQGDTHLRLQDEPLYQFYDAAVLESDYDETNSNFYDSDGYEEVGHRTGTSELTSRPSAMDLVSPDKNAISFNRRLWCEIPEVVQSSVLSTLSSHQKKLQEAKFEMITSEASYLNSLNVLNNHFIKNLQNSDLLSEAEQEILFGKIDAVKTCSNKLLLQLEKCWQDNILLNGVCEIVQKYAEESFDVYVSYCENQIVIDDTLKRLKERPMFCDILRQLESSTDCQLLTLYSFLMLPMQRITRWPLLVDAVLKRLQPQDSEYVTCQHALTAINKVLNQCNEAARRKERENELKKISNQIEFGKSVPRLQVFTENRWLIKSGPVIHMKTRSDETKLTFGKRFVKQPLTLFLFNDMLFVTKPNNDLYTVTHYCPRNLIELTSDFFPSIPVKDTQGRHLLFLTLLENQNEKTVEFLLSCSSESDKERWIEALTPSKSDDPDETLYECWDCPQVRAIHGYFASQPDELALTKGDVINVLRKMADGWYHGERIRDGQTGWFPANYTAEIANSHVRSRNLKQRYRLLTYSVNYLKTK